jgi:acetyl esterase/lipase
MGSSMASGVRERTSAMFAPLHLLPPSHRVVRDVSYGPDLRQRLDIHALPGADFVERPIILFLHGGGFVGGDKTAPGSPFYDNIGTWSVRNGFVGITMTYRLAPSAVFPSGAEDVGTALRWLRANLGRFGISQGPVIIMGHSAGATHVASFIARCAQEFEVDELPAGAILSSGIYDPSVDPNLYPAYFGSEARARGATVLTDRLANTSTPLLISGAEFDPPEFQLQMALLLDRYRATCGHFPSFVQVDGHNHFSVIFQLGTEERWFSERLARFVRQVANTPTTTSS